MLMEANKASFHATLGGHHKLLAHDLQVHVRRVLDHETSLAQESPSHWRSLLHIAGHGGP